MEKLIKNILGQWKIVSTEELNKAWVKDPKKSTPARNLAGSQPTLAQGLYGIKTAPRSKNKTGGTPQQEANRSILQGMFAKMNDHAIGNNEDGAKKTADSIRKFILSQPEGDIDFGHLNELREGQIAPNGRKHISHGDMDDFFNHHLKGAKDLKEVHDKHGGLGAVEALMRSAGANGNIDVYKTHASLHHMLDAVDLMNSGRTEGFRAQAKDAGNTAVGDSKYESVPWDETLHNNVVDTWNKMMDGDDPFSKNTSKKHEDACVARGLELFKRHHGIK